MQNWSFAFIAKIQQKFLNVVEFIQSNLKASVTYKKKNKGNIWRDCRYKSSYFNLFQLNKFVFLEQTEKEIQKWGILPTDSDF